ncbi:hypothetical protein STCU_06050 [Strigomonas culicis]|uniref:Uncharacterized protein n=1 Tax=Strigomonas culicis TaxID=28005 RepID=S9UDM7_9TRYP|nr:hypothetical protein STCU_06050 [Strigomonas culicis]|eukprot:EPY26844.1 hypothetical protein STCU_06050 [Strigomonas culicis]
MRTSIMSRAMLRCTHPLWKQATRTTSMASVEKRLLKAYASVTDDVLVIPPLRELSPTATGELPPHTLTTEALASASVPEIYGKFNVLNRRYNNTWDSMKDGGGEESSFVDLELDVLTLLRHIKEAHRTLAHFHAAARREGGRAARAFPLPDRVVFIIAFSQSRNQRGVAMPMLRMVKEAREAMERHNRRATPTGKVLRVVPVLIGLSCHEDDVRHYASSVRRQAVSAPRDYLFYPRGGLYTFNACLQCLCTQVRNLFHHHPSPAARRGRGGGVGNAAVVDPLEFRCFILSEGWLHVRTIASLHHRGGADAVSSHPRCRVEVVPGVVHDYLTGKEMSAFANYIACRAVQ